MVRYICILRGVNIAGVRIVPMEDLTVMLKKLGFSNVRTYIQSGNVVFDAPMAVNSQSIPGMIEKALAKAYHFNIPLIVRRAKQWQKTAVANPYTKEKKVDESKLYVTFLAGHPLASNLAYLKENDFSPDEFTIMGRDIFIKVQGKYSDSKLSNKYLEATLKVTATSRNWKTVTALAKLSLEKEKS